MNGLVVILNVNDVNGFLLFVWCLFLVLFLLIFLIVGILVGVGK